MRDEPSKGGRPSSAQKLSWASFLSSSVGVGQRRQDQDMLRQQHQQQQRSQVEVELLRCTHRWGIQRCTSPVRPWLDAEKAEKKRLVVVKSPDESKSQMANARLVDGTYRRSATCNGTSISVVEVFKDSLVRSGSALSVHVDVTSNMLKGV